MLKLALFVVTALMLSQPSFARSKKPSHIRAQHFKKVLTIVFENTNYDNALSQPFFKKLADSGALFTNFNGETHPSQGNYIAMISGDIYGIKNDKNINLQGSHIGDLLEAKGLSWKAYAEDYPGNCFQGATSGDYARKHLPFISFENIQNDPSRCANLVNGDAFDTDLASGGLPDYTLYVPNLQNDGHDTGVAFADSWLQNKFGSLFSDANFMRDRIVMLTFDESSTSKPNHVYTVLIGPSVKAGSVVNERHDHISLLRLVEDELNLGSFNLLDAKAPQITGIWN